MSTQKCTIKYIQNTFSDSSFTWMSSQTLSDRQRQRHANSQGQMDGRSEESDRQSRLVMQETPLPLDSCFADICWLSLAYTQRGLEFKRFTFQVAASLPSNQRAVLNLSPNWLFK